MNSSWLDKETNAILQGGNPPKIAPSLEADFSIILLEHGQNPNLQRRALSRILDLEKHDTIEILLEKRCPLVVRSSLSFGSAALGQFELICANSVSIIVRDEVALDGEPNYLRDLFLTLRQSPEFQKVAITLLNLPKDARGHGFCDQFLGETVVCSPMIFSTTRKKARIMHHWAQKIGAQLEFVAD